MGRRARDRPSARFRRTGAHGKSSGPSGWDDDVGRVAQSVTTPDDVMNWGSPGMGSTIGSTCFQVEP